MLYKIANENYELGCCDSTRMNVDLSSCLPICFSNNTSPNNKIDNKSILKSLLINVTIATGSIRTSLIDGSAVTFVSASGSISGSSENVKSENSAVCLADETITNLTIDGYTGKGSIGTLVVNGTNTQSGASVVDNCKIWIKKAGQDNMEGN